MHTFMQRQKHHDGSHFIIRQAQAGNSDRNNNHFRESNIGRVSPALSINHADVSVRGFYPKCAFYTPSIRISGGTAQALITLEDREGHQVSPVPQSPLFPGLQWHLLVTLRQDCYPCPTWHESFSRLLHNCFLSAALPGNYYLFLLRLRCFGDFTATAAPGACHPWRCKTSEGESTTTASL